MEDWARGLRRGVDRGMRLGAEVSIAYYSYSVEECGAVLKPLLSSLPHRETLPVCRTASVLSLLRTETPARSLRSSAHHHNVRDGMRASSATSDSDSDATEEMP